ncbi:carboxypeptidase-like regulatory domain-containing protein [Flagellimonas sp. HMM57]|uniref:carboxypeptidase-like regulatory domain-containing protein n=1 Tax=unclassified Flagellimonas TaxID=2644544 RepID=UPI0013D7DA9D|nr:MULTISPECIES: carboxypeptidase-like regulatory domain-containing protein [unclassified Flagellimonas]UII76431.1 carboxypeptidase-like regulatory domain-containing protein [Flagellimonas sp. HMM57]
MRLFITLLFLSFYICAQNTIQGVVLDVATKKPLEFVDAYTEGNHTLTNSNGWFELEVATDSIHFNLIGYEKFSKSVEKNHTTVDTLFMRSQFYELNEVVVTNKGFSLGDFISIGKNYPFEPYTESFFMRTLLKRNDSIIKLQDINGLIRRKQLLATSKKPRPKNNIKVHVTNMRKTAILENNIYFEMWGFAKIDRAFSSIYISPKDYDFKENLAEDGKKNKLTFKLRDTFENSSAKGYYIIDSQDMAVEEYYFVGNGPTEEFTQKRGIKYRNVFYEINIHFLKDKETALYYMNKAKLNAKVELFDGDNPSPIMYEANYVWFGLNLVKTDKIKENAPKTKDVLKLDYPYNKIFWDNQKFLLLTDEMKSFIKELQNSNSKNEYNINID